MIRTRIRTFFPDVVFLLVSAFEEFKILLEDRLESVDQNWSNLITVIKVLSLVRNHFVTQLTSLRFPAITFLFISPLQLCQALQRSALSSSLRSCFAQHITIRKFHFLSHSEPNDLLEFFSQVVMVQGCTFIFFYRTFCQPQLNWHSRKETVPLSVRFLMLGAHLTIMFIYGKCWILIILSRIFFSCMKWNFCIDSANLLIVIPKL